MEEERLTDIQEFADRVAAQFSPERIVLFGSHASGVSVEDSDVDLLIIMDFEGRPHQKAFEIRKSINRAFPLDLLVRKPADVALRIDQGDFFLGDIIRKGRVLYERSDKGMAPES